MNTKRLTFQLTPLLDLLLIVIFAQYMEMRETAAAVESRIESEKQAAIEQTEKITREWEEAQREMEQKVAAALDDVERAMMQSDELSKMMAELFRIPDEVIDRVMKQEPRSPADEAKLREMLQKLASERRNEAVKHLLAHQAMRKRCDVWDLYIGRDGEATLNTGGPPRRFRFRDTPSGESAKMEGMTLREKIAAVKEFERNAEERFATQLSRIFKTLPQPKSIVIIVVSWADVDFHWRKPAVAGVETALRYMERTSERVQFVPAILGLETQE